MAACSVNGWEAGVWGAEGEGDGGCEWGEEHVEVFTGCVSYELVI